MEVPQVDLGVAEEEEEGEEEILVMEEEVEVEEEEGVDSEVEIWDPLIRFTVCQPVVKYGV